ncbi:unnamed protein product [Rhizophagus irregularis]|nr:unnamed protein product [Rhizophagus irregularis]CAB4439096.1 unnamed protein product [Rhizophagus irregularis]
MTFTKLQNETLRSSTWVPLIAYVNDSTETFLVKSIFTEKSYLVMFTDLRYVWFEELFDDEIKKRFQELKVSLEQERLSEYIQFLSEYLIPQRPDITHKVTKNNDDSFLFESKRNIGPMELNWKFNCELIPTSLPINSSNSNEQQLDETLHNIIKSKEDEFNETVRLMSLVRLQSTGKSNKDTHTDLTPFDPNTSYDEIGKVIQNLEVTDLQTSLDICKDPTLSKLFKTATERVIPPVSEENVKLPATISYSSGAPSITELAELTSQMPTVNLPSLSDSQLSKMFTPQVLSLEDNDNNPSQASTIELPAIDSFHSTQSNEELARAQAEDRKAEEAKAKELEKRKRLKDLAAKQAEKPAKKRKKVM